jgi:hypothetical protein
MSRLFNKQLLGPLIFMLFGFLFFAIGSGMTIRQRTLESRGIETSGTVIGLQENCDSDGCTYAPEVQFTITNGQTVHFVSSYSSSPPAYDVGENVTVVYPPDNPTDAIIKGDGQFLHIIFMLIGGVIAFIGSFIIASTLRDLAVTDVNE